MTRSDTKADIVWFATNPHEPVSYEVHLYPPNGSNLSLDGLYELNSRVYKEWLGRTLSQQGLRTVFAPTVRHMSGAIYSPEWFTEKILLPYGITVRRPRVRCDGTLIHRHDSFLMSAGGCSLLVLTFRNRSGYPICLVSHAGRNSLVDMEAIQKSSRSRRFFSVINALVHYGVVLGGDPKHMILRVFGSIPWEAFRHSTDDTEYGEKNFILLTFLQSRFGSSMIKYCDRFHEHLCLNSLIEVLAREAGIGAIHAHGYGLPLHGHFPYTTHRDKTLSNPMRYLATVVHR